MQNSKVLYTLVIFDRKHPFSANLVENVKIVSLEAKFGS